MAKQTAENTSRKRILEMMTPDTYDGPDNGVFSTDIMEARGCSINAAIKYATEKVKNGEFVEVRRRKGTYIRKYWLLKADFEKWLKSKSQKRRAG